MEKNMNYIDRQFYKLTDEIKSLSAKELFEKIKRNFLFLPQNFQQIFENYFKKYDFWGSLSLNDNDFNEIYLKADVLKKHINDFIWLYRKLFDYSSKFLLYAILRNWVYYDFTSLKKSLSTTKHHYFDLDIIPRCKNVVFIDVGAYVGDTVLDFVDCYGSDCYKRIYCYEITQSILPTLQGNLKNLPCIKIKPFGVSDKTCERFIDLNAFSSSANKTSQNGKDKIKCVALDDDIKQKVDIIKMDIEGDELKALKGCKGHIMREKPLLLISVYHKNQHLYQIAKLIHQYNKNYKFYLRNYGGEFYPTEIVLYATN